MDADELDRYISGQPSREPRFDPYGRSQSSGQTQRGGSQQQPQRQSRPAEPLYEEYDNYPDAQQWDDDYGYEDDYDYAEQPVAPEPTPQQRQRTRQPARTEYEPEYEDDLYDDPYVLDDEEGPQRPQRRAARGGNRKPRRAGQSAGFQLPTFITNTPIAKDRMALGMFGIGLLSIVLMVIVVLVRRDGLENVIFTRVNADGGPENLRNASAIWNLPLIATMVTLINAALAWFLARWGEFLPRFLGGGALCVQFIVWVAVFAYLF